MQDTIFSSYPPTRMACHVLLWATYPAVSCCISLRIHRTVDGMKVGLEGGQGITEPERHHLKLEEPFCSAESGFLPVFLLNFNLPIATHGLVW